jgi:peptidoglycan/xylan/chitin deacetylase (PgdA/CDA1 family)
MRGFWVGVLALVANLAMVSPTEDLVASARHVAAPVVTAAFSAPAACPGDALAPAVAPVVQLDTRPGPLGVAAYGRLQYRTPSPLGPKDVALTFDDGPSDNTLQVLEILDQHCIKASFFVIGIFAQTRPDLVRAIVAHGHTLATHSWSHPNNLRRLGLMRAEDQIARGQAAAQAALAGAPAADQARLTPFFRFPGLNDSPALLAWAGQRGLTVVSADFGADDWKGIGSAEIQRRALKEAAQSRGGILILHETRIHTVAGLSDLITAFEQRGYRFVQITVGSPAAPLRTAATPTVDPSALALQTRLAPNGPLE